MEVNSFFASDADVAPQAEAPTAAFGPEAPAAAVLGPEPPAGAALGPDAGAAALDAEAVAARGGAGPKEDAARRRYKKLVRRAILI